MASRDEIIRFCDELLDIAAFDDYGPNGLQVPGSREVSKLATGVTATREFLDRALGAGAELAVAHHGLFFGDGARALSEPMAERLRVALCGGLSVAAYHLPLDAHRALGNNVEVCRGIGFELDPEPFAEFRGRAVGAIGRAQPPLKLAELTARLHELCGREPLVFDGGPDRISSIGIVTGSAARAIGEAAGLGLDAFVTGEPAEHAMGDAYEAGIHFIAAGHYATETFGVRRLGEVVAQRFGIEHEFIDLPNPV